MILTLHAREEQREVGFNETMSEMKAVLPEIMPWWDNVSIFWFCKIKRNDYMPISFWQHIVP